MALTLVLVPILYGVVQPALPQALVPAERAAAAFIEPLPDVAATDIVALLEFLYGQAHEADIFALADALRRDFGRMVRWSRRRRCSSSSRPRGKSSASRRSGERPWRPRPTSGNGSGASGCSGSASAGSSPIRWRSVPTAPATATSCSRPS
jgi:hypothetical protein